MTTKALNGVLHARSYRKLVSIFPPRIIESKKDYEASLAVIEKMMEAKSLSKDQAAYLELLSDLTEAYEKEHFSIGEPSLSALLAHLIEARGVTQAELATEAGISASLISDILAGRRGVSLANILRLSTYFGVDSSLFVEASAHPPEAA